MPRLVFDNTEELLKFCREIIFPKRHNFIMVQTSDNELIIHQIVSTRPIFVIYYKAESEESLNKLVEDLKTKFNFRVYKVKTIEWDSEKPVGIKIPFESI